MVFLPLMTIASRCSLSSMGEPQLRLPQAYQKKLLFHSASLRLALGPAFPLSQPPKHPVHFRYSSHLRRNGYDYCSSLGPKVAVKKGV